MADTKETTGKALPFTWGAQERPARLSVLIGPMTPGNELAWWAHHYQDATADDVAQALLANPEARMAVLEKIFYGLSDAHPEDWDKLVKRATEAEALASEIRDDFGIAMNGVLSAIRTYQRERSAKNLRHVFGTADAARDLMATPRLSAPTAESGKDHSASAQKETDDGPEVRSDSALRNGRRRDESGLHREAVRGGVPGSAADESQGAPEVGSEATSGKQETLAASCYGDCCSGFGRSVCECRCHSKPAPVAEAPERVTHDEAREVLAATLGIHYNFSSLRTYIAQQEAAEREAGELRKELEIRIADFRDSVNVMVPFPPEPGSDMAKVMIANATMRRERDAERAENAELKEADVDSCNKIVRLQEELANSQALSEALGEEWRRAGVLAERDELKAKLSEAERKLNLLLEEQRPSRLYAVIAERDEARAKLTAMALENVTVAAKLQTQAEEREALLELANEWLQKAAQMRAEDGNVGALETLEDCANEVLNLLPASQEPTGVEPAKPERRCPFGCLQTDGGEPCICAGCRPAKPPATIKLREPTQSRMPAGGVLLLDEQPEAKPPAPASQFKVGQRVRYTAGFPWVGTIVEMHSEADPPCADVDWGEHGKTDAWLSNLEPADPTPTSTEGPSPELAVLLDEYEKLAAQVNAAILEDHPMRAVSERTCEVTLRLLRGIDSRLSKLEKLGEAK